MSATRIPKTFDPARDFQFGFEPQATDAELFETDRDEYALKKQKDVASYLTLRGGRVLCDAGRAEYGKFDCKDNGITMELDGNPLHISRDQKCVEVQPSPVTDLEDIKPNLKPIFDAFRAAGLTTVLSNAAGKKVVGAGVGIHVDKRVFQAVPLLLRNLVVDVHNRPYLAAVLFAYSDHTNALSFFERGQQDAFLEAIAEVDRTAAADGGFTWEGVCGPLKGVYQGVTNHYPRDHEVNATNLWTPGKPPTVEFRLCAGYGTEDDVYTLTVFLKRYLEYLRAMKDPLAPKRFQSTKA